ncbi:MAG: hypothetical protein Q9159_007588 [Coniocarpon cinnabarinum]
MLHEDDRDVLSASAKFDRSYRFGVETEVFLTPKFEFLSSSKSIDGLEFEYLSRPPMIHRKRDPCFVFAEVLKNRHNEEIDAPRMVNLFRKTALHHVQDKEYDKWILDWESSLSVVRPPKRVCRPLVDFG